MRSGVPAKNQATAATVSTFDAASVVVIEIAVVSGSIEAVVDIVIRSLTLESFVKGSTWKMPVELSPPRGEQSKGVTACCTNRMILATEIWKDEVCKTPEQAVSF
tara:strand:+ start:192 stop:506 length:315 start_codon:yes stop_codon:yes gene_type:complete